MKKLLFTLALTLLSIGFGNAQDKFRADYNYVCFYDPDTKSWSDWEPAEHTIVFNYNANNDIVHFTAKGEMVTYRNTGIKDEGYTNGNHYQTLDLIDEDGDFIRIQLFDDQSIGMKLIWGNYMIQFSKTS
jgi:hypothetical protein